MYTTIVTGTDGSDSASAAVLHAAKLAALCKAKLYVVSAVSTPVVASGPVDLVQPAWLDAGVDSAQQALARVMAELGESTEIVTEMVRGDPATALLNTCRQRRADLLVVGNKGMHGKMRFILGSVANKVAHHAECAVLIVPTS